MLKNILFIGVLILWTCLTANRPSAATITSENCALQMGWEQWIPFQYLDEDEHLTGFDIELIRAIAADMDCQLSFKRVNWARGIVEVRSGELDLLPHADHTDERSQWAYFSSAYRDVSQVLYGKPGFSKMYPFTDLEDIIDSDFRLGVGRGVFVGDKFEELIAQEKFREHIVYIPTDEIQQYKMLHADRIDGYVRSATAIESLLDVFGDKLHLEIHPLPILTSRQHFLFSQVTVDRILVDRFNASLEKVIDTGFYKELESRFLN